MSLNLSGSDGPIDRLHCSSPRRARGSRCAHRETAHCCDHHGAEQGATSHLGNSPDRPPTKTRVPRGRHRSRPWPTVQSAARNATSVSAPSRPRIAKTHACDCLHDRPDHGGWSRRGTARLPSARPAPSCPTVRPDIQPGDAADVAESTAALPRSDAAARCRRCPRHTLQSQRPAGPDCPYTAWPGPDFANASTRAATSRQELR